jgi:fructokinase
MTNFFIGIDLGGTKTEVILLDSAYQVIWNKRQPTPSEAYSLILDAIVLLINQAKQQVSTDKSCNFSIGIGTPGSLDKHGNIRNSNTQCLNGKPLQQDVSNRVKQPIFIENDANCLALSEAHFGHGKGHSTVFCAILGTGVGGGIVINKTLLSGKNRIAGEWGHNALPRATNQTEAWLGQLCYCGKTGCIETFLCGPAVSRRFSPDHNHPVPLEQLIGQSESLAQTILEHYANWLARALSDIINIIDPDIIILGGGVSKMPELAPTTQSLLAQYIFSDSCATPIVLAQHGDASGVRGAALLANFSQN